MIVAMCTK